MASDLPATEPVLTSNNPIRKSPTTPRLKRDVRFVIKFNDYRIVPVPSLLKSIDKLVDLMAGSRESWNYKAFL